VGQRRSPTGYLRLACHAEACVLYNLGKDTLELQTFSNIDDRVALAACSHDDYPLLEEARYF